MSSEPLAHKHPTVHRCFGRCRAAKQKNWKGRQIRRVITRPSNFDSDNIRQRLFVSRRIQCFGRLAPVGLAVVEPVGAAVVGLAASGWSSPSAWPSSSRSPRPWWGWRSSSRSAWSSPSAWPSSSRSARRWSAWWRRAGRPGGRRAGGVEPVALAVLGLVPVSPDAAAVLGLVPVSPDAAAVVEPVGLALVGLVALALVGLAVLEPVGAALVGLVASSRSPWRSSSRSARRWWGWCR